MNKRSKSQKARDYDSPLRAEQAAATRVRILEAAIRLHQESAGGDNYTALAREAGVSVPTVYRYFPQRKDLFEAVYLHIEAGRPAVKPTDGLNIETLTTFFARFTEAAQPSRLTMAWQFSRAATVPRRQVALTEHFQREAPGLAQVDLERFVDIGVLLLSSAMAQASQGYLDLDPASTADRVLLAFDALTAHARSLADKEQP